MKKLFFVGVLAILILIGLSLGKTFVNHNALPVENTTDSIVSETPRSTDTPIIELKVEYYPPQTLIIPKIGIQAPVEKVGEDSQGRMDVPKNADNVGWYEMGFKIGERGPAVLAGHFDKVSGAPAVFYNLNRLNVGDEMEVIDEKGKRWNYVVIGKKTYDFDKVPLEEIFGSTDKIRLNLITCDGAFDRATKNYSKRTVVFTQLKQPA